MTASEVPCFSTPGAPHRGSGWDSPLTCAVGDNTRKPRPGPKALALCRGNAEYRPPLAPLSALRKLSSQRRRARLFCTASKR